MKDVSARDEWAKYRRNVGKRRHRVERGFADRGPLVTHSVMRVHKVALRFLEAGTVVRAEIPYADGVGRKVRPAVVVGVVGNHVEVVPCTSSQRADHYSDVEITDLANAGLRRATRARTGRRTWVDRGAVIEVLGSLSTADLAGVLVFDGEAA